MLLKNLEYWVLSQIALEAGLIIMVFFFLIRLRSLGRLLAASRTQEQQALAEMGGLAARISELDQQRAALEEHLAQLSHRANGLQGQLALGEPGRRISASYGSHGDRGLSLRAQVEGLARQGFSPDDIARHLGLNLAEVKVALDLARVQLR